MSTEIFASRFVCGEAADFPASAVREAFAAMIVATEPQRHLLDAGGSTATPLALHLDTASPTLRWFMVSRPVDDARLYRALLQWLQAEGRVVYAPGSRPVVGHAASTAHLPPGLVAALGPAVQAGSAAALRSALFDG